MIYLKELIESLRQELQQYGEMLARFDDADANQTADMTEEAFMWVIRLQEQEQILELALGRRDRAQRQLARRLSLPEAACLTEIMPLLPREHQVLVRALMEENKELCTRVQQRVHQKRQLLRRSLHRMESCLTGWTNQPVLQPSIDPGKLLLQTLTAVKNGDFSTRLPVEWTGPEREDYECAQ